MSKARLQTILVADDNPEFLRLIEHHLRSWSYRVECATDKAQLLRQLDAARPALVLLDVRFGEHNGVEVLRQVLADHPGLRLAMLTAYASIDDAIAAIKLGAIDYLTKPVDLNRLRALIAHAIDTSDQPRNSASTAAEIRPLARPILGESPAVVRLRSLVARTAATDATVLILGESGTGKELVARALHEQSARHRGPFVALNMAALPGELVESTLFGHAKGAFTGADRIQHGCCEAAEGGTLFLDEIGEMDIGLQAKLLRFLQERSFHRVGQSTPVSVDVRIIAATNRNPLELVRTGLLREDLYYRLNVVPIVVPPLRDRRDDIPFLANHFLRRACERWGRDPLELTPAAIDELSRRAWPGNVRELESFADRLAVLSAGPAVGAEEIRADCQNSPAIQPIAASVAAGVSVALSDEAPTLREIDRIEKAAITQALAASNGNVCEAAQQLGLGQATVYRKIKKYGITVR